ncbi:MAG: AIPR family protein, partial [Candidatus Sulfotelmatobacter sp.]
MDRITKSLLDEFASEHDLTSLAEDKQFEHFASYLMVRRHYAETFEPGEIVTGAGGDTGIDAIAIVVNNVLVTDAATVDELLKINGYLEVVFVFIQADRSPHFDSSKIGNFGFGIRDFFSSTPQLPRNRAVQNSAAIMSEIYRRSSKFMRGNPACRGYYVTTGKWVGDPTLVARFQAEIRDLLATGLFKDVDIQPIGAVGIQRSYNQSRNAISREFLFANRTVVPEIAGVKEAHLGFIPADEFLKIICDEEGWLIRSLFYENVRDWQNYNEVNSEIRDTLLSSDRDRFVLMNNGITIIARTLQTTANRFVIGDFQVVNGCQTSHVLYDNKNLLEGVRVPIRLISTQDEGVIGAIIRATNRQTEVRREQFFALTDLAKKIEHYFASFPAGQQLYYERRSRQYDSLPIEKTRVVTQTSLIKAYGAMFLGEAHRTTRDFSALAEKVGKEMFLEEDKLDPYYTSAFALYKIEYQIRNQRLDAKYNRARFAMIYAARILANPHPLPPRNSRNMEKYCATISRLLWDARSADELFENAASVIDAVSGSDLNTDTIRTQPFTEAVERKCREIARVS